MTTHRGSFSLAILRELHQTRGHRDSGSRPEHVGISNLDHNHHGLGIYPSTSAYKFYLDPESHPVNVSGLPESTMIEHRMDKVNGAVRLAFEDMQRLEIFGVLPLILSRGRFPLALMGSLEMLLSSHTRLDGLPLFLRRSRLTCDVGSSNSRLA